MKIKILDANTHLNYASGYGQMSAAIASGLSNLGHDVYYDYVTGSSDSGLDKLAKKKFTHTGDTIYLWIRPPHYIKDSAFDPKHINVFYTMHEKETFDGWKSDWVELLNKVTYIITPTEWNKNVFLGNGVTRPISVIPLGVNTNTFYPQSTSGFGVLTVHEALGSENSRENWKMTIDAFLAQFKDRNAYLTIKSWNVKNIPATVADNANVNCTTTTMFPRDMATLYRSHQLFIKNSNREGWSLPLTEAMASGMFVLCFDCPVLRENVRDYPFVGWFKNEDQLKYHMDEAYRKWRDEMKYISMFSWKNSVALLERTLLNLGSYLCQ